MADISMTFSRKGGLGPIGPKTARLLELAVKKATLEVEREAKLSIQTGPKTGRTYRRGKRVHQASAPGEAPATDFGTLVNSGRTRIRRFEGRVIFSAEHAARLEIGGAHVAARPFLRPATLKVRPKFIAACQQAIRQGARA